MNQGWTEMDQQHHQFHPQQQQMMQQPMVDQFGNPVQPMQGGNMMQMQPPPPAPPQEQGENGQTPSNTNGENPVQSPSNANPPLPSDGATEQAAGQNASANNSANNTQTGVMEPQGQQMVQGQMMPPNQQQPMQMMGNQVQGNMMNPNMGYNGACVILNPNTGDVVNPTDAILVPMVDNNGNVVGHQPFLLGSNGEMVHLCLFSLNEGQSMPMQGQQNMPILVHGSRVDYEATTDTIRQ